MPEQLCAVQLVPQTIGYWRSVMRRTQSASSGQKTPIAPSVAALADRSVDIWSDCGDMIRSPTTAARKALVHGSWALGRGRLAPLAIATADGA